jgi:site-specific DNA-methyltransferase (adenine-specific)
MTIHHGDCLDIMPTLDAESIHAIVTDPPYGLEFMGKAWDRLGDIGKTSHQGPDKRALGSRYGNGVSYSGSSNVKCRTCGKWAWTQADKKCVCAVPDFPSVARHQGQIMQRWHEAWAREAFRVARPSAYLLAFGGTRTVHRMACAIEDAGWIIRDLLVWAYASGFPKSKASLKPAWEPIVMARKPGPLRMLAVDECRIAIGDADRADVEARNAYWGKAHFGDATFARGLEERGEVSLAQGRWPANVILTDPIFDGDVPGVVGGGETAIAPPYRITEDHAARASFGVSGNGPLYGDSGTYSRFFLIPKAARSDREPVLSDGTGRVVSVWGGDEDDLTPGKKSTIARRNVHPTVKPTGLMRHLVRLVTPQGGTVLDPFLGSGTTALAAEMEGFGWVGIEREAEYIAIAEARLNGTQRGMGLETA